MPKRQVVIAAYKKQTATTTKNQFARLSLWKSDNVKRAPVEDSTIYARANDLPRQSGIYEDTYARGEVRLEKNT